MSKRVWKAAFLNSLPVLMGYVTMGIAAGILLAGRLPRGDIAFWGCITSASSISGTLQFLLPNWFALRTPFAEVVLLTLCVNLRYAMYGFSLLERFRGIPLWQKCYLIWALTDETYAIEVENRTPPGEDSTAYCLCVTFLDHCYWICGVVLGSAAGSALKLPVKGIDFAMTALFLVILTDQCREKGNRLPAALGAAAALTGGLFFPVNRMLIPAIVLMCLVFLVFRKKIQKGTAS